MFSVPIVYRAVLRLTAFVAVAALPPALHAEEKLTPHEQLLKRHGIGLDSKGLADFLQRLHPTAEQRREAKALVLQLGDADFFKRSSAMKKLTIDPHPPLAALKKAAASNDAEVRWRARKLLAMRGDEEKPLLFAVLRTIVNRKPPGLIDALLKTIPLCSRRHLLLEAGRALTASARSEDVKLLRRSLNHKLPQVQAYAATALARVLSAKAFPDLHALIASPPRAEIVVLAAAKALANLGDRESLSPLVALLSSEKMEHRIESAAVLHAVTGKRFGFVAYDSVKNRAKSIRKWDVWLTANRTTAKLRFPLKKYLNLAGFLNGRTLLAYGYKNKVVELSAAGKITWTYSVKGPFSAEKLANGNVLIASYQSSNNKSEVIEVRPDKKVVWRMSVPSCLNARPLTNGNILIAGHASKQVLEVTRTKKIIWKFKCKNYCYDAHRLPNGNTLIATNLNVIEVTKNGKTVWVLGGIRSSYGIQPLSNGNILVAEFSNKRISEITREKKTVWTYSVTNPFDVFRLPNGNTLITTSSKFLEVTPGKTVVWTRSGNSYGRARK